MADQLPPKQDSLMKNPQIIATIIGGFITLVVAIVGILPALLKNDTPTPAPTIVIVIATQLPPTASPERETLTTSPATEIHDSPTATEYIQPTNTNAPEPTQLPAATNPPLPTAIPNVILLYDSETFSLLNQSGKTLSLEGVFFRSTTGEWEARKWGPSVYNSLPADQCLRLRDNRVGDRTPPSPCRNHIYGLQQVGTSALFWVGVDSFDVVQNDVVIATCAVSTQSCSIAIQ